MKSYFVEIHAQQRSGGALDGSEVVNAKNSKEAIEKFLRKYGYIPHKIATSGQMQANCSVTEYFNVDDIDFFH